MLKAHKGALQSPGFGGGLDRLPPFSFMPDENW
jgi:hypothetical protein